jgi:hypothetical protein
MRSRMDTDGAVLPRIAYRIVNPPATCDGNLLGSERVARIARIH